MIGRRAGVIVALGALAFGTLVFLASGIVHGLREEWVQMASSFVVCAYGVLVGMISIFAIRVDACFRALENRLSTDPLPYQKTGSSVGFALSLWPGVVLVAFLALGLIAASRGDFFTFGLGLLAGTITAIVSTLGPLITGSAWRIKRLEALLSTREARGNSGANAEQG